MKLIILPLWTILVALNIYDAITTLVLLEHDGKELNPIPNWFIVNFKPTFGLFILKFIVLAFLTFVTDWMLNQLLNARQKVVIVSLYLIAVLWYAWIMYSNNYTYMQSFS